MDGWTSLLLTQADLRTTVIDQYFTVQALNQCAIALGTEPVRGVTLHTDVLGQTVFSALGENVVAGAGPGRRRRSEEEQRKFMQTIIGIVDRTANVAANLADVSSNEKLTKGERTQMYLSQLGGPVGVVSLVGNIAQGIYTWSGRRADDTLLGYIHGAMEAGIKEESKPLIQFKTKTVDNVKNSFNLLVERYNSMEKNQEEAIKFLKDHLLVPQKQFLDETQDGVYQGNIPDVLQNLNGIQSNWKNNKLYRALFLWTQTVLGAFNQVVNPSDPSNGIESPIDAKKLDARVQARLGPFLNKYEQTLASKVQNVKSATGSDVSEVCGRITEAFRRDSVATRLLLEALLVVPPKP
jgi:hypothetical protein